MSPERRKVAPVNKDEAYIAEIGIFMDSQIDRMLDMSEERKRVVSNFLLWTINPNSLKDKGIDFNSVVEKVYEDPKLELASNFIASWMVLVYPDFEDVFEQTIIPAPALHPQSVVRLIKNAYGKKPAREISEEAGVPIIDVYSLCRQLKRKGELQPKSPQFGYSRVGELELDIALDWNRGLSRTELRQKYGLTLSRFEGIANKLIETGLVRRKRIALTKRQKEVVDTRVLKLANGGKSRREIAEQFHTTDGVVQASIRRLIHQGRLDVREVRYTDADWEDLEQRVREMRRDGIKWETIEDELNISTYRSNVLRQRAKSGDNIVFTAEE